MHMADHLLPPSSGELGELGEEEEEEEDRARTVDAL